MLGSVIICLLHLLPFACSNLVENEASVGMSDEKQQCLEVVLMFEVLKTSELES